MKESAALLHLIRQSILNGQSRKEILNKVYQTIDPQQAQISGRKSRKFFNKRNQNDLKTLPKDLTTVIKMIDAEFKKARRGMSGRMCVETSCKLQIMSPRYAIEIRHEGKKKQCSIYLYDMLHGQRKKLRIEGDLTLTDSYHFHRPDGLNSVYFLISYYSIGLVPPSTIFHLMELDIPNMKCTLLDKQVQVGIYYRRISNLSNSMELFCQVQKYKSNKDCLQRGHVVDLKLQFDDVLYDLKYDSDKEFSLNYVLSMCRLETNKVYEIGNKKDYSKKNTEDEKFVVHEFKFEKNQFKCQKVCEIQLNDEIRGLSPDCVAWSGNVCYALIRKFYSESQVQILLYKFDIDSQKATKLDWSIKDARCIQIHQDDGVLTICTRNDESKQHAFHRITVDQPDSLFNLTMHQLRQQILFMDAKEYKKFTHQLPKNLQPFGF